MEPGIYTFKEALGGYALGCGLGILVALLFAAWRPLAGAFMPYAVAANAIPIIAFAPIMNNWFGLAESVLEDGDRRRALLLPGDDQHAARPDLGRIRRRSS